MQGLLSSGRKRALVLLARYMDTGVDAVGAALEVGMFPYIVRLLKVCLQGMASVLHALSA